MAERQDRLDRLIDDALTSYGKAPDNEGLAQRILVRVAETGRSKHSVRPLMLAISAALTAGTAYLSWWVVPKVQIRPARTTMVSHKRIDPPSLQAIPLPNSPAVLKSVVKLRTFQNAPATPKLAQFPTPSSLSREEQALVTLVTGNMEHVELSSFRGGPVEPIQITALEIKPLRSGVEHEGGICCDQQ